MTLWATKLKRVAIFTFLLPVLLLSSLSARAQLTGTQNFLVLRVQFKDITGPTYNPAQTQTLFDNIKTLWGTDSSYGVLVPNFRISSLYPVPQNTSVYVDLGNSSSTATGFTALVNDAVANAPMGTDFSNLTGLIILFADPSTNGTYIGWTYTGVTISPPGVSSFSLPVSVVSEDPGEGMPTNWGRIAHEMGHQMQRFCCLHPSNYQSSFEQMDAEYPAQTGVFEKQDTRDFPGWLPPSKYAIVSSPEGGTITLLAAEAPPGTEPDYQAVKALLSFGGNNVYYMVSVRRRRSGDDLATTSPLVSPTDCDVSATPNGIPDCGVLIERVVEKGDQNIDDVTSGSCAGGATCYRWVNVLGKAAVYDTTRPMNSLWHGGDTYRSSTYGAPSAASDNINIAISRIGGGTAPLDPDHYKVTISYGAGGAVDVGLEGWLQPPGNTYETTDIWIDSPLNGYASPPDTDPCSPPASNGCHYRYGIHSDLLGGTVPIGNGDNPAVGQVNRIYARIRNYGTQPAVNATVFFDVTEPLGVGINGSNGFKQLGSVDVASIPPGGHVDVYLEWTPNVILTKQQIADGQFYFHSCIRVRVSHVAGETYFGNQDGNGQQENIDYFDATGAGGGGGAPGPANQTVIHLRNDSPSEPKQFMLGVLRDTLPPGWDVNVNNGDPVVELAPGAEQDIPVSIKQNVTEAIGTTHQIRIIASSQVTFTNPDHPTPHNEARALGGVTMQVSVLRKTAVNCRLQNGVVTGQLTGLDPRDATSGAVVAVVPAVQTQSMNEVLRGDHVVLGRVLSGSFTVPWPYGRGVCLYAGSTYSSSSGSAPF